MTWTEGSGVWLLPTFSPFPLRPPTDLDFKAHSYWQRNGKQNEDILHILHCCHCWTFFYPRDRPKWEFGQKLGDLQM